MRTLLLMRGAPGCGKSTFIKQHGLEPYTLCADTLRLQYHSTHLNLDGDVCISQQYDNKVWNTLFDILEHRMQLGCFTVIDATNSKTKEMKRYKDLAATYRYRMYIVDMTDVPLEVCKERNANRSTYKRVPDAALENIYARFATQDVPSGIKVIKPDNINEILESKPFSYNDYENVHIIGDIHGCFRPLNKYMSENWSDRDMYVFLGDYLDRGTQNAEVFRYIDGIKHLPNVLLIEGNHERWLNNWGNDIEDNLSGEFKNYTLPQLREAKISKKDCRNFYRKLAQCAFFNFGEENYFCCHGGLSGLSAAGTELQFIPTRQMIHGVGRYSEYENCTKWWNDTLDGNKSGIIQINGHRNINKLEIGATPFTYNLEGAVEFGGDLRVVKLSKNSDGVVTPEFIYTHNEDPIAEHLLETNTEIGKSVEQLVINNDTPVAELVSELRNNKYVNEKTFGNISSFNFSREAFNKGVWDNQTMRARGLYIDTVQNRIFARSYNKFWKLYEMPETQLPSLARNLKFPLKVYSKENGYLGLISYNYYDDSLFFTTKSTPDGEYTKQFKQLFEHLVPKDKYDLLKEYLKTNDCTLTVEVVDPAFDPHIIEYDKAQIYLLDLVANTIEFSKQPFEAVLTLAGLLNLECKTHCTTLYNWEQFEEFLNIMNTVEKTQELCHRDYIEGYVIEDAEGYMFKTKSDFYNFWKGLRSVAYQVIKSGNYRWTGSLQTPMANYFYKWIKDNWREYHDHPENKCDIITLRKEFLKSKYNIEEGQVN